MKAHWYRSRRVRRNFGDELTHLILDDLGIDHEWAPSDGADLFGIGSILDSVPSGFDGVVWSTGKLTEQGRPDLRAADVISVRGRLTLERITVADPDRVLLGDGGLVCHRFAGRVRKRHKLGIVLHYVDIDDPIVADLATDSRDIAIIDVRQRPLEVIQAIAACEHIVSSSLHGLVVADSLRIPNSWLSLERGRREIAGKGFKFRDYYSIFDIERSPLSLGRDDSLETILGSLDGYDCPGIDHAVAEVETALAALADRAPRRRRATARPRNPLLASVVITSHNYATYLRRTIESALSQTYRPTEVIVVDDGSTDGSPDIVRSFGDAVTAVLKENGGQGSAFNAGFQASRGDAVCFLDSDDLLHPTALEQAVPLLDGPNIAKVHWPLVIIDHEGRPTGDVMHRADLDHGDLRDTLIRRGPAGYNWPSTSGNLWSRHFLESVLPMPEAEYRIGPDVYLSALAPLFGCVRRTETPQGSYRVHPRNNTKREPFLDRIRTAVRFWDHSFDTLQRACSDAGIAVERAEWERWSWWHQTAAAAREIMEVVAEGEAFVLAGEDQWAVGSELCDRHVIPFPGRGRLYWGAPADDGAALDELDRVMLQGAHVFVLPSWCFSWLEEYPTMAARLHEHPLLLESDRVLIFDVTGLRHPVAGAGVDGSRS